MRGHTASYLLELDLPCYVSGPPNGLEVPRQQYRRRRISRARDHSRRESTTHFGKSKMTTNSDDLAICVTCGTQFDELYTNPPKRVGPWSGDSHTYVDALGRPIRLSGIQGLHIKGLLVDSFLQQLMQFMFVAQFL